MRRFAFFACSIVAGLGALAAGGLSGAQTLPTATVPSATVPSLTVAGALTTPTLTTPSLTTPSISSAGTQLGSGSLTQFGMSAVGDGGSAAASNEGGRAERTALRLSNFRVQPRGFKNRPRGGEGTGTTFRFRLSAAAAVTFRIRQESPSCQREGRFGVAGRAGANTVPFNGWLAGEPLPPGTYTVRGRARQGSATSAAREALFVVVARRDLVRDARPAPSRCPDARTVVEVEAASFGGDDGSAASGGGETGQTAAGEGHVFAPPTLPDVSAAEGADSPEAAGGDRGGFPGPVPEPTGSPALIVAAALLLGGFVLGNLAYAWWLRRGSPVASRQV